MGAFTYTGVLAKIAEIKLMNQYELQVTFTEVGTFTVNKIMDPNVYESLQSMSAGACVTVATHANRVMWVNAA